jgi:translation initiation factor 1A
MDRKDDKFGDFEEVKQEGDNTVVETTEQGIVRVRMPKGRELIGSIVQRLGGNRMDVRASDGKSRNCRVPGRYKRRMWLRPGDVVLIEPWEDDDGKGDVIFKYTKNQANQLRKKGFLDFMKEDF